MYVLEFNFPPNLCFPLPLPRLSISPGDVELSFPHIPFLAYENNLLNLGTVAYDVVPAAWEVEAGLLKASLGVIV